VVAFAGFVNVGPIEFFPSELLNPGNGFEHGDAIFAAAAHVIDLARTRIGSELFDGTDDVMAVNVVTDLFAHVPEDAVLAAGERDFDEIRKKAVKLNAGMRWTCKAAAPKNSDIHFEVAAVFLRDQIGRGFRSSEERMKRLVNAATFGDAVEIFVTKVVQRVGNSLRGISLGASP